MDPKIFWHDRAGQPQTATLLTSAFSPRIPARVEAVDDTLSADLAFRKASEGCALIWEGDYQNARQLLSALARRLDTRRQERAIKANKPGRKASVSAPAHAGAGFNAPVSAAVGGAAPDATRFHAYRMAQANRARVLGMVWVVLDKDYGVELSRAPDVANACSQAFGKAGGRRVMALRELLGVVGAAQWRERGVSVPALGADAKVHPYFGVFSPVRGEYLDMVQTAALPAKVATAWDVGTGTGVLAAILARRGVGKVVGTENSTDALACAHDNIERLGLQRQVKIVEADMFPEGKADLIVCNPPWLPAKPTSCIELAIYDADSRMLTSFVRGLAERLNPEGEGWLILSDLAVRLGLRSAGVLDALIAESGLRVLQRLERKPMHAKALDADDPLAYARAHEMTSLWRLARAS